MQYLLSHNEYMDKFRIYELVEVEERAVAAIRKLLAQLSSSEHSFGADELQAIVESSYTHLFVAEYGKGICGMLTLGEYLAPTGRKMWIEDVVVDEAVRGNSIGRRLVEHAQAYAASSGGGVLMLTSRPSRVAANNLYRSCGFGIKETNIYRMCVADKKSPV